MQLIRSLKQENTIQKLNDLHHAFIKNCKEDEEALSSTREILFQASQLVFIVRERVEKQRELRQKEEQKRV